MERTKFKKADLGQVEITNLLADLSQMRDLKEGLICDILPPPKGLSAHHRNWHQGVWVQGVDAPVMILFSEFKKVKK